MSNREPLKKKIWICKKCGARLKKLGGMMEKPKECPCGSEEIY